VNGGESKLEHYTAADGRALNVHIWSTAAPLCARVVFLHGISSHAGWYGRGNRHLATAGIEVHFLERRGSGVDNKNRGDVDHWQTWTEDVAVYLRQLQLVHSSPVALCGISWGGKLAAAVARQHTDLVGRLGLICPGLFSPFEPGPLKRLALRTPLPRRLQRCRLAIPLQDPALFTDTPFWQSFIRDDPLTLRKITWRFAREDRALTRYARGAAPFLTMPVLLILSERDRIIDNQQVISFYNRIPSLDKTLIEYPEARHTLEFESDPYQYFADLGRWLCEAS
jgi:alpha-beta hydrolase superfamily lysophospholipase